MAKIRKTLHRPHRTPAKPFKILDIDLDFFLENICFGGDAHGCRRITGEEYKPWPKERVVSFLENNCGLSVQQKIRGAFFAHHHKLFHLMTKLRQVYGQEVPGFSIDHIDGHSDLGNGDYSLEYIATELLFLPLEQRDFLRCSGMAQDLDPGNFLVYALACRLLTELNFIIHPGKGNDVPTILYKDYDKSGHALQLKKFTRQQMDEILVDQEHIARYTPVDTEPAVPFRKIPYDEYRTEGDYDLIFLAHSPTFTPVEADELIPVIMEYMDMDMGDWEGGR